MPVEDRTRHDRLRSLLPRNYATEPGSVLGTLLEALGNGLRNSDRHVERALRDKWLRTASGARERNARVSAEPPAGWQEGDALSPAQRELLERDAAKLGVRIEGLFASSPAGARVLVGELGRPLAVADFGDFSEIGADAQPAPSAFEPALATGRKLLLRLKVPFCRLIPEPQLLHTREGALMVKMRWAQPSGAGDEASRPVEAIEVALAPAGPFTAVALLRGPQDDSEYRQGFGTLLREGITGLSDTSAPPLPEVALAGPPNPLELLGAALGLRRQPWESDHEAYRNRVRILAPLLAEGVATPRALLSFALTSLGAEPCPVLDRPDTGTVRAYGMPPRHLDRCRRCRGGGPVVSGSVCPQRERAIMQAVLTDSPRTRSGLSRTSLAPRGQSEATGGLRIGNDSLFSARPELALRFPADVDPETKLIPRFGSETTGEEIVLPAILRPGDVLHVRSTTPHEPGLAPHAQRWVDLPPGEVLRPARAYIRREVAGEVVIEELEEVTLYASGHCFDRARFAPDDAIEPASSGGSASSRDAAAAQFAAVGFALTPELVPGANDWRFAPISSFELESLLADYSRLSERTKALPNPADSFPAATCRVALELSWWTRPPARFLLRVPRSRAVERALASGAAEYLRAMIERVRPAGVQAIIDFALEPFRDTLEPEERIAALAIAGTEELAPAEVFATESALCLDGLDPGEQAGFMGIFDVTRFEFSRFDIKVVVPGRYDRTEFDWSTATDFGPDEPGKCDETYYDHALLTEPTGGFEDED